MLPAPDMERWIFYKKKPSKTPRPFFIMAHPISLEDLETQMEELYKQIFGEDF